jgi:molecular chaperone IbpA
MDMRNTIDFAPYRPSWIGFDRLFDMLESTARQPDTDGYPPFDLEQSGENTFRIRLAVAGFTQDDIEITAKSNVLVIAGRQQDDPERKYLYRGIAARPFERQFQLADHVQITGAKLSDGLLEIELKREIPDEVKPRRIEIATTHPPTKPAHAATVARRKAKQEAAAGASNDTGRVEDQPAVEREAALSGAW